MPRALNPNHPVVREAQDQWYKLCAIMIHKQGLTEIKITAKDIEAFMASGRANITIYPKEDTITLRLVTEEEAQKLARQAGGLPN
jgi:hypothetical protein